MKRFTGLLSLVAICSSFSALAQDSTVGINSADHAQWGMLDQYCLECHNYEDWAGEVAFDLMTPGSLMEEPDVWEKAVRKLRGRLMPPPGSPQPEQKNINEFVSWVETTLDANNSIPRAGHVPVQRMNRTEYARSVQELIGVAINAEDFLPTEIEVDGFDNIAEALSVSPAFLNQYISAARQAASLAVGNASAKTSVAYYAPVAMAARQRIPGRHASRQSRRHGLQAHFPRRRTIPFQSSWTGRGPESQRPGNPA